MSRLILLMWCTNCLLLFCTSVGLVFVLTQLLAEG